MLINYLRIAIRNLIRHKGSTFINILGLSIGLACCALIALYIADELSYDRFHRKSDRIYRVTNTVEREGDVRTLPVVAAPVGPALVADFPEIQKAVRLLPPYDESLVTAQGTPFYEKRVFFADPSLFEVFDLPLRRGDSRTALLNKNSVVLSAALASKYFGNDDPLGKTLTIERGVGSFQVTGVLEPIPATSSIMPDIIIPFNNLQPQQLANWLMFSYPTFVLLSEKTNAQAIGQRLSEFVARHYGDAPEGFPTIHLGLQPLLDIHLHPDSQTNSGEMSATTYLYLFAALALIIVTVACVNFVNLATARSQERAREVGIRKTIGSRRSQLVLQFLSESVILSFISAAGALGLIELFLSTFNALAQKSIEVHFLSDGMIIPGLLLISLIVGVVAGSYPALVLSRFQPSVALKGGGLSNASGGRFRQFMVGGQFVVSIALIACTLVVNRQITYIHEKGLGFDKDQVVIVPLRGAQSQEHWPRLKAGLLQHSEFTSAAASSAIPGDVRRWITGAQRSEGEERQIYSCQVDHDIFTTLGMELVAGRFLSPTFPGDSAHAFVINEAAVRQFGWESAEAAIGQPFSWLGYGPDYPKVGTIVGVVKDFHFRPLYEAIAPAVFHMMPEGLQNLLVRIKPGNVDAALEILANEWHSFDRTHPLEYSFMDDRVEAQYGAETRLVKILGIVSLFAICISCMGLFGLISFTTEQRTKEIGIRKVLGASVSGIVGMLSKEFITLVLIANIIAWPLCFAAMNRWLEGFAYRITIDWLDFALAGGSALMIALLTVSTHAMRAANANPVEALRYE